MRVVQNITAACNDIPECDPLLFLPAGQVQQQRNHHLGPSAVLKTARLPLNPSKLLCVLDAPCLLCMAMSHMLESALHI